MEGDVAVLEEHELTYATLSDDRDLEPMPNYVNQGGDEGVERIYVCASDPCANKMELTYAPAKAVLDRSWVVNCVFECDATWMAIPKEAELNNQMFRNLAMVVPDLFDKDMPKGSEVAYVKKNFCATLMVCTCRVCGVMVNVVLPKEKFEDLEKDCTSRITDYFLGGCE